MQAEVDQYVPEQLERFLSWLLDARWFPETDDKGKRRLKSELRSIRRILVRMQAFTEGIPDVRLQRAVAEWQSYESNLAALVKQPARSAPRIHIGSFTKRSPEIAQRLMCAALIIRKLRPEVSVYQEIQRLLADPKQLPYPITVSEEAIQELRAGTLHRPVTASELHYLREGRDIPMRAYWRSVKAIESSVARLEKQFGANKHTAQLAVLEQLYAEYLWSQKFQAGFSEEEAAILRTLVPPEGPGKPERIGDNS